jgi:hypothetical protein
LWWNFILSILWWWNKTFWMSWIDLALNQRLSSVLWFC